MMILKYLCKKIEPLRKSYFLIYNTMNTRNASEYKHVFLGCGSFVDRNRHYALPFVFVFSNFKHILF